MDLGWPAATIIIVTIVALLFRKPLTSLMDRAKALEIELNKIKLEVEDNKKFIEKAAEVTAEKTVAKAKKELTDLMYGTHYDDHQEAFLQANRLIDRQLEENSKRGSGAPPLEIKIMAVGMAYSWNAVVDKVPSMLKNYPRARIDLKILIVDPEYLELLNISKKPRDWAKECRNRISDVKKLSEESARLQGRICFSVKTYKALPHWHGILIDGVHLFLGRTNWWFEGSRPELYVGQNRYRYFNSQEEMGDERGSERVELFDHWHRFYWEFASVQVDGDCP